MQLHLGLLRSFPPPWLHSLAGHETAEPADVVASRRHRFPLPVSVTCLWFAWLLLRHSESPKNTHTYCLCLSGSLRLMLLSFPLLLQGKEAGQNSAEQQRQFGIFAHCECLRLVSGCEKIVGPFQLLVLTFLR